MMTYQEILQNTRLLVKHNGFNIDRFHWDGQSRHYQLTSIRSHIPAIALEQIFRSAYVYMEREVRRQLERVRQGIISPSQWRDNMVKICAAQCDFRLFVENGGLDVDCRTQVQKDLENAFFVQERRIRAEKDRAYLDYLVSTIHVVDTDPEANDPDERVLALLSEEIQHVSPWHEVEARNEFIEREDNLSKADFNRALDGKE